MKKWTATALSMLIFCLWLDGAHAANGPTTLRRPSWSYNDELSITLREIRDSLDDVKAVVRNHEEEIRTFENKVANQEDRVDSLRSWQQEALHSQKEALAKKGGTTDSRIAALESAIKELSSDLRKMRDYAKELEKALGQYHEQLVHANTSLAKQSGQVDALQTALRSITEAIQLSDAPDKKALSSYTVKNGDSLEKIARQAKTTVQEIIDANNLKNTKILVGQKLKLPEGS